MKRVQKHDIMDFQRYQPIHKNACLSIFDSNRDTYFATNERRDFLAYLDSPEDYCHFYVGYYKDKIVACGGIAICTHIGELCWGMVDSLYHQRGFGAVLTEFRLTELQRKPDIHKIRLESSQHSVSFYQQRGFVIVLRCPDGFGPGIDCVSMEKHLVP